MLTRHDANGSFAVIPAVDVLGDEVVRLERGEFGRVVAHEPDPSAVVERFVQAGAPLVHVVDLNGARWGKTRPELIRRLAAAASPARIQASGGVRSPADAQQLIDAGATRVVVGTSAFADQRALERYAARLGPDLLVAVDVRGGRVVARGWSRQTDVTAEEAAERCAAAGVSGLLCTAVERDGTLAGPDLDLLTRVRERSGLPVLAAGGIRSRSDLAAVEATGCRGAVVGRALLQGGLPLSILAERG